MEGQQALITSASSGRVMDIPVIPSIILKDRKREKFTARHDLEKSFLNVKKKNLLLRTETIG